MELLFNEVKKSTDDDDNDDVDEMKSINEN
jgi:hypothetical protein